MQPLPPDLQGSLRVNWHITSWCNYSCQYCPVTVFHQRSRSRQKQAHSFDYQPVSAWLEAIRKLDFPTIHLKISGGEPFLDRKNFRDLLAGLSEMKHIRVGVDTNGYWDPEYFRSIDKSNLWLNVAFHPTQTPIEQFLPNLLKIRDAGFTIPIVNYVLAPENLDLFESVMSRFEREGFFLNISTMISTGIYISRNERTDRELDIVERYNTPLDNHFKILKPRTKARPCFYPAMTYYFMYDGSVRVACLDSTARNLFTDGVPALPRTSVPCPYEQCVGCSDMYRALADEPLITRPLELFTLEHYAEEVQDFRRRRAWNEKVERLPFLGKRLRHELDTAAFRRGLVQIHEVAPVITVNGHHQPLPGATIFGQPDQGQIEARSRDRISISGWAASRASGAPVREVQLHLAGENIGVIREFFFRPDIATTYGKPEFVKSGWKSMIYLPKLGEGDYELVPRAIDHHENTADLAPIKIRIAD